MINLFRKTLYVSLSIVALTITFVSCSQPTAVQRLSTVQDETVVLPKIAVVPFQRITSRYKETAFSPCPISGAIMHTCDSPEDAAQVIEGLFVSEIKKHRKHVIISPDKARSVYMRISANTFTASPREVLRMVGREIHADWIVTGYVYCMREREGYSYSAKRPASVTFCIHLVRVADGKEMWKGVFDKQQESLMENLLSLSTFSKGLKWLTARELSEVGVEEILKTFPGLH